MVEAILSFIAGLLTALAPCVLPLLPVIVGGSLTGQSSKKRPYIITASLVASLILFTILLKVSTALIGIEPRVWSYISGGLVTVLGVITLFPRLWDEIIGRLGIQAKSQSLLGNAMRTKNGTWSAVLTGAALGPVFSSCSPTYSWVIATVLPKNGLLGVLYLGIYCAGVAVSLLAIALMGRKLLDKIKWLSNPHGSFQKIIGVLFIIVGLSVATGFDKKAQTWLVEKDFLNLISLEQKLVPEDKDEKEGSIMQNSKESSQIDALNIVPYKAPELRGTADWINSEPLTLEQLKGKVVLIDFWTYSCINCIRTLPYLQQWYETYADDGFVIIGVHAPEFAFEKLPKNVQKAVTDRKLTYPITLDNEFSTWQAYKNRFWPASYIIDAEGNVRREHFGEGEYDETEEAIRALLEERGAKITDSTKTTSADVPPISRTQTPETYLGTKRQERFVDNLSDYTKLPTNSWTLTGGWSRGSESSTTTSAGAKLTIRVNAKKVFLVMGSTTGPKTIKVSLDGQQKDSVIINDHTLYTVLSEESYRTGSLLELEIPAGVEANAFTFES